MAYEVFIPARLNSSRLPGKVLLPLAGKPVLQHVYEAAQRSQASSVRIATDSDKIAACATAFGAEVIMTDEHHPCGTSRVAQAAATCGIPDEQCVVVLQGDVPLVEPRLIDTVAATLTRSRNCDMATLAQPLTSQAELDNPNCVKVVLDATQRALYFSRSPIPYAQACDLRIHYKHIGIYAYRHHFLQHYMQLPPSPLEQVESLEQLRVLYHGYSIATEIVTADNHIGIDTAADYERAQAVV